MSPRGVATTAGIAQCELAGAIRRRRRFRDRHACGDIAVRVYCADIGSISNGKFGWAGRGAGFEASGTSIEELGRLVATDLESASPVALGFECPLFVPFGGRPSDLGCARQGEGARPWSAQAGAASLATGLVQVAWLLDYVRRQAAGHHRVFLDWASFIAERQGLFVWEAFVSAKAKGQSHVDDATAAVEAFLNAMPELQSCLQCHEAYSLVGAALLRTGWTKDLDILAEPAVVVRAAPRLGNPAGA